jgi:hypothetical protein
MKDEMKGCLLSPAGGVGSTNKKNGRKGVD